MELERARVLSAEARRVLSDLNIGECISIIQIVVICSPFLIMDSQLRRLPFELREGACGLWYLLPLNISVISWRFFELRCLPCRLCPYELVWCLHCELWCLSSELWCPLCKLKCLPCELQCHPCKLSCLHC